MCCVLSEFLDWNRLLLGGIHLAGEVESVAGAITEWEKKKSLNQTSPLTAANSGAVGDECLIPWSSNGVHVKGKDITSPTQSLAINIQREDQACPSTAIGLECPFK